MELKPISSEFEGASLGDARLERRALKLADTLAVAPDESFPELTANDGELEALYRFLNNERVTSEALLQPHYLATAQRAETAGRVLVIHDTTGFTFGGETRRKGLGRMKAGGIHGSQGFYAHMALVAALDSGTPLGVVGTVTVVRDKPPIGYPDVQSKRHNRVREYERWENLVELSSERLPKCRCIHVMDREGDAYTVFCRLVEKNQDFVIRSKDDRILDVPRGDKDQPRLLHEALECSQYVVAREVHLSTKRSDRMARLRKAPGRMMRTAKLEVRTTRVDVRHPPFTAGKSRRHSTLPRAVPLNVVYVREKKAPAGQKPISWVLLTNLPIDTVDDVNLIIDSYRRRWLIEEYNKALKSGCSIEKRQLESKHALLNALALFIPIAWRLLALRTLARATPNAPASRLLTHRQVKILRARKKVPLGRVATTQQALLAIAAEGGHIKNNGDPGWQVLGRGYEKLLYMELGYVLAEKDHKL